jgi:uncharacterized protein DUF6609
MHPFPLIRSGGLFVLIVGASIMAGALARRLRWPLFLVGITVASVLIAATAPRLVLPLGKPTVFQIETLIVAVLIEVGVIVYLDRWLRSVQDRQRTLVVLLIVGGHFIVMTPAFGPLIGILGALSIVNALAALMFWAAPVLL